MLLISVSASFYFTYLNLASSSYASRVVCFDAWNSSMIKFSFHSDIGLDSRQRKTSETVTVRANWFYNIYLTVGRPILIIPTRPYLSFKGIGILSKIFLFSYKFSRLYCPLSMLKLSISILKLSRYSPTYVLNIEDMYSCRKFIFLLFYFLH